MDKNELKRGPSLDACFHEVGWDDSHKPLMPILQDSFCKTARKIYDPAVMLAYCYASAKDPEHPKPAHDGDDDHTFAIMQAMQNLDYKTIESRLKMYCDDESIDDFDRNDIALIMDNLKLFFGPVIPEPNEEPYDPNEIPTDEEADRNHIADLVRKGFTS
jgi:hypothetical protein